MNVFMVSLVLTKAPRTEGMEKLHLNLYILNTCSKPVS